MDTTEKTEIPIGRPVKKVNKHSRAKKDGTVLRCPKCDSTIRVYHFSWSALGCQNCREMIEKNEWEISDWGNTK